MMIDIGDGYIAVIVIRENRTASVDVGDSESGRHLYKDISEQPYRERAWLLFYRRVTPELLEISVPRAVADLKAQLQDVRTEWLMRKQRERVITEAAARYVQLSKRRDVRCSGCGRSGYNVYFHHNFEDEGIRCVAPVDQSGSGITCGRFVGDILHRPGPDSRCVGCFPLGYGAHEHHGFRS